MLVKAVQWDNSLPVWLAQQFLISIGGAGSPLRHRGRGARACPWDQAPQACAELASARWTESRRAAWRETSRALPSNWWESTVDCEFWSTLVRTLTNVDQNSQLCPAVFQHMSVWEEDGLRHVGEADTDASSGKLLRGRFGEPTKNSKFRHGRNCKLAKSLARE